MGDKRKMEEHERNMKNKRDSNFNVNVVFHSHSPGNFFATCHVCSFMCDNSLRLFIPFHVVRFGG